ncbi:hypothetical protein F5883DRAFT_409959 [Diaporthe sp. PMI_573]|nr:hypothetical protein F5883DRAFT_409959 [Diaporthaceae sp. PMI_573]
MHPALKRAFEAAYLPKHPNHRDLVSIDFGEFFSHGIGEETFAQLSTMIDQKISDLVSDNTFAAYFEASRKDFQSPVASLSYQGDNDFGRQSTQEEREMLENPCFKSIVRAAEGFDDLKWMFEEQQDILATFVQKIAVQPESMQPRVDRIRARRV